MSQKAEIKKRNKNHELMDIIIDTAFYANRMDWNKFYPIDKEKFNKGDKEYYNDSITFLKNYVKKLKRL